MVDEPGHQLPTEPSNTGLLQVLQVMDGHVAEAKADLMTAIGQVRTDLDTYRGEHQEWHERYETDHAALHTQMTAETNEQKRIVDAFMRSFELAKARRDGILGMLRFAFDLLGRNWRLIGVLAATLLMLLGRIHVDLGLLGQ